MKVLAIDPGRQKCGFAVVSEGPVVHFREIVETDRVVARLLQLLSDQGFERVLMGDGTQSAPLGRAVREALKGRLEVEMVPEAFTSQRARARLAAESLPRGLRRLVPVGMRTPPRPYDDYVAVLLAEDWFAQEIERNLES